MTLTLWIQQENRIRILFLDTLVCSSKVLNKMNATVTSQHCHTAFAERSVLSKAQTLTIAGLLCLLSPMTCIVNVLLCYALVKTKQMKQKSQRFIFILGISDLCVGTISIPLLVVTFSYFHIQPECWYERFSLFISHFNTRMTAYVVFMIGIDRYFNITTDLRSQNTFGKYIGSDIGHRVLLAIVTTTCAIQAAVAIIDFENRSLPNSISSAFDAIIYFTYLFLYIRLFYKIRKFSRNNSLHLTAAGDSSAAIRPKYVRNLIKTVIYLLLTVGFCYLPYVVVKFITTYVKYRLNKTVSQTLRFVHYLSFLPIVFNSFLNTVIILNRNSVLKKYLLAKIFNRHDESQKRGRETSIRLTMESNGETLDHK